MNYLENQKIIKLWLFLLLIFPFFLWFLPADFFDNSQTILCPSRLFFDFECFGCGMTRAVQHLHHFQYEDAAYFNKGSFFVYPVLVIVWFKWLKDVYNKNKFFKK
jgi:hypothetical protein